MYITMSCCVSVDKLTGGRRPMRTGDAQKVRQNLMNSLTCNVPFQSAESAAGKRYIVINHTNTTQSTSSQDQENVAAQSVSLSPNDTTPVEAHGDQILLKAHLSHPSLPEKQPTLLKLSKTQLQSVLNSISQSPSANNSIASPVVRSTEYKVTPPAGSAASLSTAQVQNNDSSQIPVLHVERKVPPTSTKERENFLVSPPDLSRLKNRKRPLEQDNRSAEQCYFDAKRPKKDADLGDPRQTGVDSEVAAITGHQQQQVVKVVNAAKPRPSPLRALHLEPEFQSPQARQSEPAAPDGQTTATSVLNPEDEDANPATLNQTQSVKVSMAAPTQTASAVGRIKPGLMRSKSASPSTFMFGSRGVGSLRSEASSIQQPQQCTYITASPSAGLISPLVGCPLTPSSITLTPTAVVSSAGYQLTPTSSFAKPIQGVVPSKGAIVNLVPHLVSSAQPGDEVTGVPVSTLSAGGTRLIARNLSAEQITALRLQQQQRQMQTQQRVLSIPVATTTTPQTQFFRLDTQTILQTPTEQQSPIVSPSVNNNNTPSTQVTPRSFFQSTPSGSLIQITTHQISPSAVSAFRVINGQTFTPIAETVAARRLALSDD